MPAIASFIDFNLNKQVLRAIEQAGFSMPTPIQQKCIPVAMAGQDVIGIAQTGTGKTAAYLIPVIMKARFAQGTEPRVVVLAPTKELVVQIAGHTKALCQYTDLRVVAIYGGVGPKSQIEALQEGVDILVATPGRFMELYLKGELLVKQLKTLVLDEADRMMDMGFMPQLRKIFEVIPRKRQNLLFSATFHERVERLSSEFLEFPVRIEITPPATPAVQIKQTVYRVPNLKTKINLLEYFLLDRDAFNRVIIFTRTKAHADNVFKFIDRKKLGPARVIHSNKGQNSRINAVDEFKEGILRVLVSTDVTARGIDVRSVSHVINFDVPILYDDYVHRIGRTGRAFQDGVAITFATDAEWYHIEKIQKLIRETIPVSTIPNEVTIEKTAFEEAQALALEIDNQKKKEDPSFKGAFHERTKLKSNKKRG